MALGMKGKDEEGLKGVLNSLKENGADAKDVGKALNLAGFSKEAAKTAVTGSKLSDSIDTVVTGFDAMATATTGIKGKFNTMKDGAEKLGKALKTKVTTGAKGAWVALKKVAGINPLLTAGVAAAGIGFGAYKLYQAHKDNRLQDASEDADKWQSKNKSLSEQITQYDSLKSQLDAGTASAQEEYNIRSQILEIQNEITSAYGDQAAGIDLVNGSLDEQKAKLEEIRQEKADEFIRDNSSGIFSNPIKDAKKAMETEKNNHIADSIGEGTKQYTLLQKAISRTNQKLKEQGFTGGSLGLEKNGINGTYSLDYKGNAENSKTVQTALQKELKEIAPEAYDTLKEISDWITSHASDASAMNSQIKTNKEDITKLKTLIGTLPDTAVAKDIVGYIAEYVSKALADSDLSQYAKAADLTAAVGRIDTLEKKIPTLETADKTNADNITAVSGRVTTVEGKVKTLENDMATEKPKIAANTTAISALQGLVGDGYEAIPSEKIKALFATE